jgi:hypothetical protein
MHFKKALKSFKELIQIYFTEQMISFGSNKLINAHLTFRNQDGSVEHFYHFLLGFLVPLVRAIPTLEHSFKINNFYVRSCAVMDEIINEIDCPKLIIIKKDQLKNVKNSSFSNKIKYRRFYFVGYDHAHKYNKEIFSNVSEILRRRLSDQIASEQSNITRNFAKNGPKIVLIDRGNPHEFYASEDCEIKTAGRQRRSIGNFDELESIIKNKYDNVISVVLEGRSFSYQIALFQLADIVISQHGAALSNLIWAREGISVIEISPQDLHPKCREAFGLLARCLGQNYYRIEQLHSHGDVNISDIVVTLDEIISD